jgi:hypothetical protein
MQGVDSEQQEKARETLFTGWYVQNIGIDTVSLMSTISQAPILLSTATMVVMASSPLRTFVLSLYSNGCRKKLEQFPLTHWWSEWTKAHLIRIFTTNTGHESVAYQSFAR